MMRLQPWILALLLVWSVSCTEYTPKPRGYFRIEPVAPHYDPLPFTALPYAFKVSQLTVVELSPAGDPVGWINLSYPSLKAKIYCSYLPISPATLSRVEEESRMLVVRQAKDGEGIREQAYSNPDERVYGSLFLLAGETASPVQFMLTDSVSHFFRGALYFDSISNPDSLTPVTLYLQKDIMELIQSFSWKK